MSYRSFLEIPNQQCFHNCKNNDHGSYDKGKDRLGAFPLPVMFVGTHFMNHFGNCLVSGTKGMRSIVSLLDKYYRKQILQAGLVQLQRETGPDNTLHYIIILK